MFFTLGSQGKYAEAEKLFARCQAIHEKVLDPDHPDLANTLRGRANLLAKQVRVVRLLEEGSGQAWVVQVLEKRIGWLSACSSAARCTMALFYPFDLCPAFQGMYAEAETPNALCVALDGKDFSEGYRRRLITLRVFRTIVPRSWIRLL